MNGDLFQDWVILLEFQTIRSILPVLLRDIPTGAGHTRCLVLSALQNNLVSVTF